MNRTVINVVSGKGGTGKTLFACVLANMLGDVPDTSVVVVDLDVFVRGLTSLLYFHHEEKHNLVGADEPVVANFFVEKTTGQSVENQPLAIKKYRSFDIVPAVSKIDQELEFKDVIFDSRDKAKRIVENILSKIPDRYRFVILDSRAGYDELISATHSLCDVSICVEEQDPICQVTANNLVAQLKRDSKKPLFRLINKARWLYSEKDIKLGVLGHQYLGLIPFDMDVLNSFGSKHFWREISRSLYRSNLARAWNRLSSKLDLGVELKSSRISPVGNEHLEARMGLFAWPARVLFVYGLLIFLLGTYGLFGREISIIGKDPLRVIGFIMGMIGLGFSLFSVFLKRRGP